MFASILDWWRELHGIELILWVIAIFFTLLFLGQALLSFIGGGDYLEDADLFDADGGYQFLTIKNLIAFFTMFGWAGLAALNAGWDPVWVVVVAIASGTAMVALMYLLMRNTSRLQNSGTLELRNAVHQTGQTYLRIPGRRSGIGKVQVQVQGRLVELDAMTDDREDIATGRPIRVVNIINNQILLVTAHLVA